MAGFTVVVSPTAVGPHLSHLMQVNASRLLGCVEPQALVEHVTKAPKLIEDVVPKMVGIATLQRVLQLLLEEGVHIQIRAPMARLLKRAAPRLKVLSQSVIPETHSIRIGSIIGSAA